MGLGMVSLQCIEAGYVQKNIKVNPDSYEMVVESPKIAQMARPGQFVMVSCSMSMSAPLLRRPLSIHDVNKNTISLLYRVVGEGTKMLSQFSKNESISVLGSLGTGFSIAETRHHCLVGGGIGIAPLLFLAKEIARTNPQNKITVLAGARNAEELLVLEKFENQATVHISTDDGSMGLHGFVTELLDAQQEKDITVYTCGPTPMMKGVAMLAKKHSWACQVSLESHMACGVGACLGCAVSRSGIYEGADKYIHVCKDGPVFNAEEIWT